MHERFAQLRTIIGRRRERRASKRMALRLAVFLGAVIALPFAYWQFQFHEVLGQAATTEELAAKCEKLDDTLAAARKSIGLTVSERDKALDYRLSECDEMGIEVTTGSIGE